MNVLRALIALTALVAPAAAGAQTKIPAAFLGTWAGGGIGANNTPAGAPPIELPYQQLDKKIGEFQQPWAFAAHEAIEWNTDDTGQACKLDGMFRPGAATGGGGFRFVPAPATSCTRCGASMSAASRASTSTRRIRATSG